MRSAITMSPDPGGAFDVLLALVALRSRGHGRDGRQFVSWIHEADFVARRCTGSSNTPISTAR